MALDFLKSNPFKDLPKPVIYGGLIGTAGLTGYLLVRHHKETGKWFGGTAASSSGSATTVDPVTGLAYSQDNVTDPLTGETYLAEAQQYGSVAAAEAAVSAYGATSATGSGIGVQPADGAAAGTSTTAAGAVSASTYTSNAAWAQAAIAGLEDISGGPTYNGTDIATTIGDVLQGEPVTAAQQQVWNAAVGEFGQPPVAVSPILQPVSAPGVTQVTVPRVTGLNYDVEQAEPIISGAGLKPAISPNTNPGGVRTVESQSPAAGTKVNPGSTVTLTWKIIPAKKG